MNHKTPRYNLEFGVTVDVQTTFFFLSSISPPQKVFESLYLLNVFKNLFVYAVGGKQLSDVFGVYCLCQISQSSRSLLFEVVDAEHMES